MSNRTIKFRRAAPLFLFQASVQVENCDQIDVSVSTTATTFYGIPEPATNARVVNDTVTSDCVIEWQHKDSDLDVLYYTVNQDFLKC